MGGGGMDRWKARISDMPEALSLDWIVLTAVLVGTTLAVIGAA